MLLIIICQSSEDHRRARTLSDTLIDTGNFSDARATQTNMVYVSLPKGGYKSLEKALAKQNIVITGSDDSVRLVCHHDHQDVDIHLVVSAINQWAEK